MPTYQYACTECDHRFEAVQAFSDPSLTECPVCGGRLRKVYGSVGVVFKGSGFYRTDSRAGGSDGKTAPVGDGGSSGTADKPAAKSDSSASTTSSTSGASSTSSAGSSTGGSTGGGSGSSGSSSSSKAAAS